MIPANTLSSFEAVILFGMACAIHRFTSEEARAIIEACDLVGDAYTNGLISFREHERIADDVADWAVEMKRAAAH